MDSLSSQWFAHRDRDAVRYVINELDRQSLGNRNAIAVLQAVLKVRHRRVAAVAALSDDISLFDLGARFYLDAATLQVG